VKERILVVDATQGIEAQTLANLYLAIEADLEIIPVVNKIDLPAALPDEVAEEVESITGIPAEEVIPDQRQTGQQYRCGAGSDRTPRAAAEWQRRRPLAALVFDSHYDSTKGLSLTCASSRAR
jgi:GTP-binding protein LepA